ncbi:bifunctional diguanylate cyclase/phosphodiesterase [Beijerinckia sp. L45]|uniref:bifunctional diguanylate cyclase/phosphodiesterase n=1 Tax=Beijerinckia sp. L45 TaxID=1641855 RepID=UPI00131A8430|nr:bifunctional diguanylate cyclase/phosphodiesterase [Beijerinckia sp. L45]
MALKQLSRVGLVMASTFSAHDDSGGGTGGTRASAQDVTYDWDLATDAITWGATLPEVIGFADPQSLSTGLGYAEHLSAESASSRYEAIMASGGCDAGGGVVYQVVYGLSADPRAAGATIWIEDTGRWFADANGRPGLAHGVIRAVTERHEAERLQTLAAQRDPLTGAYNERHFIDHINRHLTLSGRKNTTFAVLLGEVVVSRRGQAVDTAEVLDDAISAAASRIRQQMRANEALARYDETRLAMLLENCNGEQMATAAARLIAAANFGADAAADGVSVSMHVGGVIAPLHGRTPTAIMRYAHEAMEVASHAERPMFVRYEPEMVRTEAKKKLSQATDEIIAALNEGRVVLALQPIVDAKTRTTVFSEALVRIRLLDGTLLMPDVLVPAAEQGGLVALLDRRVVDLAFTRLVADRHMSLSVNASVTSLHDQQWQEHFRAACARHPGAASRLTVEITETCAVADLDATRSVLLALKAMNVKIAIDDFGSGHSSFRNLRDLPIDYLKIDGAFARNLAQSPDDRFFIRTLIDLAKNLRIPTVAEWVEDEATAQILTEWGIDLLQGHLFGRAEVSVLTPGPMIAFG